MNEAITLAVQIATLLAIVVGLYKVFQEARASKAVADLANSNAQIAAANAQIAAAQAEVAAAQAKQANVGIAQVAGTVREIATNTDGMQKRMELLVRADERHIADERVFDAKSETKEAAEAAVAALTSAGPIPVVVQQEEGNPVPVKPVETASGEAGKG